MNEPKISHIVYKFGMATDRIKLCLDWLTGPDVYQSAPHWHVAINLFFYLYIRI